jgi:hypothetical protein
VGTAHDWRVGLLMRIGGSYRFVFDAQTGFQVRKK